MASANIYLNFNGNCEEAFTFYKSVFGVEYDSFSRFNEIPEGDDMQLTEADKEKVMHVAFTYGSSQIMGSDTGETYGQNFAQGNNFSISISTDSKKEADRLFNELSEGGRPSMPMADTFWGDYFGMLTDKFGINWMIGFAIPQ